MIRPAFTLAIITATLALPVRAEEPDSAGLGQAGEPVVTSQEAEPSEFIGRYNGNSFETAMGMVIREDGTFEWGVSVGAMDMRAMGTWRQQGEFILLTSDPKPVAPEFIFSGIQTAPGGPLLRVVWASNGEPFQYAAVRATCRNGNTVYSQVYNEGWSPDIKECDAVETVQLREDIYEVASQTFDLQGTLAHGGGETFLFEFQRNDMGVADFSGMTGVIEDGVLKLNGGRWPLELRKVPPR